MLFELNGVPNNNPVVVSDIPTGLAFSNFNVLVQNNILGLKDLLNSDSTVLNGPVKQIYHSNGMQSDYNTLLKILAQ